jgi:hypothetical protein
MNFANPGAKGIRPSEAPWNEETSKRRRNDGDRWHTAAIAVHIKHRKPETIPTASHILRNQRQHGL